MFDFEYSNAVRLVFGKNVENRVGTEVARYGKCALVVVGGDFIYETGLYQRVTKSLDQYGISHVVFDRVNPNPRMSDINDGINLGREEKVDFILAIGGGSAIDSAKLIAAGIMAEKPLWHYFENFTDFISDALPIGVVLTLPASGSEVSHVAVATQDETGLKRSLFSNLITPRFACINPELGATLSLSQLSCGAFDAFSHLFEMYFTHAESSIVTDYLLVSGMRAIVTISERLAKGERSYDLLAELFLAANLANNGLLSVGRGPGDWGSHNIGHELSAAFNLPHGMSLALIIPAWIKQVKSRAPLVFASLLGQVFLHENLPEELNTDVLDNQIARGISALEGYIRKLDLPTRLSDVGITKKDIPSLAASALQGRREIGMCYKLNKEDVEAILRFAL